MRPNLAPRLRYIGAGVIGAVGVAVALWTSALAPAQDEPDATPVQSIVAAENAESAERTKGIGRACPAGGAADFDHYWLGAKFEGLKLVERVRTCEPPPREIVTSEGKRVHERPVRLNDVAYIYGDCPNAGACVPPLQVISAPGCERPHSLYERYAGPPEAGGPVQHEDTVLDGAKAAIFDDGQRIEIYTGDATVTVAGESAQLVREAAHALTAAPSSAAGRARRADRFPEAAAGIAEERWQESAAGVAC
jgi:hypothetical protein